MSPSILNEHWQQPLHPGNAWNLKCMFGTEVRMTEARSRKLSSLFTQRAATDWETQMIKQVPKYILTWPGKTTSWEQHQLLAHLLHQPALRWQYPLSVTSSSTTPLSAATNKSPFSSAQHRHKSKNIFSSWKHDIFRECINPLLIPQITPFS